LPTNYVTAKLILGGCYADVCDSTPVRNDPRCQEIDEWFDQETTSEGGVEFDSEGRFARTRTPTTALSLFSLRTKKPNLFPVCFYRTMSQGERLLF
jgi:hypothetical protein